MKPINNVRALRHAITQGQHEFRLCLNGGAYSAKSIEIAPNGRFIVFNHIDETEQNLTGRQLYTHSNIGIGMRRGSLLALPQ